MYIIDFTIQFLCNITIKLIKMCTFEFLSRLPVVMIRMDIDTIMRI